MKQHIVHAFDEELERVGNEIEAMGRKTVAQLERALTAFRTRDLAIAERTVTADAEIDALEHELAHDALQLLALRQPMASDLRETLAAIRMSEELERVGDLAKGFARRGAVLEQFPPIPEPLANGMVGLAERVLEQLRTVVGAYADRDAETATTVWRGDAEVDDRHEALFRELLSGMMKDPKSVTPFTHLAFMAKDLERVGDHCTRMANAIHYLVEAKGLPERRPKGADTRTTIVAPNGQEETS